MDLLRLSLAICALCALGPLLLGFIMISFDFSLADDGGRWEKSKFGCLIHLYLLGLVGFASLGTIFGVSAICYSVLAMPFGFAFAAGFAAFLALVGVLIYLKN